MTANIVFFLVFDSDARMNPARLLVQSLHFERDRMQNRFPLLLAALDGFAAIIMRSSRNLCVIGAALVSERSCRSHKNKRREKSRAGLRVL
ncbi:MAG: hypothetical protein NVV83_05220 [Afipia sp.]|jgi:hypothetical protein|nr:hypothetical protein [Afipia sp.]